MAERKKPDWEAIGKEFRANQLSIREIAKKHGITHAAISTTMKRLGVTRDLTERIANRFNYQLVTISNTGNEDEIVETAANQAVEVVSYHRDIIQRGISLVNKLAEKVERQIESEDVPDNVRASTLVSLSLATKNYIDKQRQAFNLDALTAPQPVEDAISTVLELINGQGKVLPTAQGHDDESTVS